jgi:hypothetical protein
MCFNLMKPWPEAGSLIINREKNIQPNKIGKTIYDLYYILHLDTVESYSRLFRRDHNKNKQLF